MPPRSLSSGAHQVHSLYSISDDCSCDSGDEVPTRSALKRRGTKGRASKPLRFAKSNQIFPIPHLDDLSDDEVKEIWYDASEYTEIKSCYQATIFMIESGELKETDEHTARGLEYRTQQGAWARYENKRDAYNAVLDEQDRQWKVDKDDFDEIGRVYLEHSTKCAVAAATRGAEDAKQAKEICQDILKKRRKVRKKKSKHNDCTGTAPRADKVQQVLRNQSFSRREQIRNDIEKQQAKAMKKEKRIALAV